MEQSIYEAIDGQYRGYIGLNMVSVMLIDWQNT